MIPTIILFSSTVIMVSDVPACSVPFTELNTKTLPTRKPEKMPAYSGNSEPIFQKAQRKGFILPTIRKEKYKTINKNELFQSIIPDKVNNCLKGSCIIFLSSIFFLNVLFLKYHNLKQILCTPASQFRNKVFCLQNIRYSSSLMCFSDQLFY